MRGSEYLAPHQTKVQLVPYGIPLDRFLAVLSADELARVRAQYAIDSSPLSTLLFVGRLRYYKGLDVLINALSDIAARVLIVGIGPMMDEWQALAKARNVADKIMWLGEVPDADLPTLYRLADLFVLPATHTSEAFALVQVEAMASGVPVVCTELGTGTSWVNVDGQTGLVVQPRNPPALTVAINQLLADPDHRRVLGEAARARAMEFSVDKLIEHVLEVYQSLIKL
jgi:rhamnosyl/mannosyltransferase